MRLERAERPGRFLTPAAQLLIDSREPQDSHVPVGNWRRTGRLTWQRSWRRAGLRCPLFPTWQFSRINTLADLRLSPIPKPVYSVAVSAPGRSASGSRREF